MKTSEFAGNLPRNSTYFCCSETKSNVQESNQTEEDQERKISPSGTVAQTAEMPETYMPPVETLTVLQSALPGANVDETTTQSMGGVTQEIVNLVGLLGAVVILTSMYTVKMKLRSLTEGELETLVEVNEESPWKVLVGASVGCEFAEKRMHADVVGVHEGKIQEFLFSTPVKSSSWTKYMPVEKLGSRGRLSKQCAGLAFVINEEEEILSSVRQSGKKRKSNDGECCKIAMQLFCRRLRLDCQKWMK